MEPASSKWLFTKDELKQSPSFHAGIQADIEKSFRQGSLALMKNIGDKILKQKTGEVLDYRLMGREVMYSAATLFHRFFTQHSIAGSGPPTRSDIVFGALLLAMKSEDYMTAMPGVFEALVRMYLHNVMRVPEPIKKEDHLVARDAITAAEFALLTSCEFDFEVPHPNTCYKALIDAMAVSIDGAKVLVAYGIKFVEDSLRTQLCLMHPCVEIARASLLLAALTRKVPLPEADVIVDGVVRAKAWRSVLAVTPRVTFECVKEIVYESEFPQDQRDKFLSRVAATLQGKVGIILPQSGPPKPPAAPAVAATGSTPTVASTITSAPTGASAGGGSAGAVDPDRSDRPPSLKRPRTEDET